MMQDTILSLGKESVRQFVSFLMKYIPKETHINSTSLVVNIFEKQEHHAIEGGPEDDNDAIIEEDIPESEMTTV